MRDHVPGLGPPPDGTPSGGSLLTEDPAPKPFFSVIVTAYRRRKFLAEAVSSVLAQTLPARGIELIVVKDFADPELDSWLSGLGNRVRVVTEDHTLGEAMARGVTLARGEVICFLDDDDRIRPEKLSELRELFSQDPTLGFVRNSFDAIDAQGRKLPKFEQYRPQPSTSRTIDPESEPGSTLSWVFQFGAHINLSSMAIRSSIARSALPWMQRIEGTSDIFLFFNALTSGAKLRIDARHWNDYRVHGSSSHAAVSEGQDSADLRELARHVATGRCMAEMYQGRRKARLSNRFLTSYRLESTASAFVMDPDRHFGFADWITLARTIVWRRQRYLLVLWSYCPYRWLMPKAASHSYRARRHASLRQSAEPATPL